MTTPFLEDSTGRSPLRHGLFLIALALAWFAFSPTAHGQLSPPPDGGYPNGNTAEGDDALFSLDISQGVYNTAVGFEALHNNFEGSFNTASGSQALSSNTTGNVNTANGYLALYSNTAGDNNTANAVQAQYNNTVGNGNTANNTATGNSALVSNFAGNFNTANGVNALYSSTGDANIALGFSAGFNITAGNNNIDIGNLGVDGESNTTCIWGDIGQCYGSQTATFIAGINGVDKSSGSPVFIDANGQLGTGTALPGPTGPTGPNRNDRCNWSNWRSRHEWNGCYRSGGGPPFRFSIVDR